MTQNIFIIGAALLLNATNSIAQAPAAVDYEKQILPIFQEKCFDCHQKERTDANGKVKKPKGKLRMDSVAMIMKGGSEGIVLTPGDPAKSPIYITTTLPADDDKVMPPKGDPLTKEQQDLVKQWIIEGAKFGTWTGAAD
jgi:mono/diheme cytochrome c family protein